MQSRGLDLSGKGKLLACLMHCEIRLVLPKHISVACYEIVSCKIRDFDAECRRQEPQAVWRSTSDAMLT